MVPILLYHSISEGVPSKFRKWAVPPQIFATQMAFLYELKYQPITVTQFARAMAGGNERLPDRPVVLTFDDGFADFYTQALPVLKQYGFTATLYIATGLIGNTNHWLYDQSQIPFMTWDQIVEVSADGIECGAHSHSHPQLDTLSSDSARQEIFHSKMVLEHHLERQILTFSYPHGYFNSTIRRLVQVAGYTSACAVKGAMSSAADDPFALARIIITADADEKGYSSLLAGHGLRVAPRREQKRTKVWRIMRRLAAILKRQTSYATQ